MSLTKKTIFFIFIINLILLPNKTLSEEIKKVGKFKDWETITIKSENGIVCFAQTKPVLQSPKNNPREARLFVTFRPSEKISNEISITAGYEFNKKNSIVGKSGKNKYKFDISQDNFAWIPHNKQEKKNDKNNEKRIKNYDNRL